MPHLPISFFFHGLKGPRRWALSPTFSVFFRPFFLSTSKFSPCIVRHRRRTRYRYLFVGNRLEPHLQLVAFYPFLNLRRFAVCLLQCALLFPPTFAQHLWRHPVPFPFFYDFFFFVVCVEEASKICITRFPLWSINPMRIAFLPLLHPSIGVFS